MEIGEKYNLLCLTPLTENFKCARQSANLFVYSVFYLLPDEEQEGDKGEDCHGKWSYLKCYQALMYKKYILQ